MNNPAVVLGTDVSALAVVRSLGRRGIPVFVVGVKGKDYASVSRYARFVKCEDLNREESVLEALYGIEREGDRKIALFATADLHVLHIVRNREGLSRNFCFVLPDVDVVETLMDKRRFSGLAASRGYAVPKTLYSNSLAEIENAAAEVHYPCVVKPLYRTAYWSRNVSPDKKVLWYSNAEELLEEIKSLGACSESLVIQEWIPGGDEDVCFCLACLDRDGKPIGLFSGRKLRQYPPLTGVTSLAVSLRDSELEAMALKVLTHAGCKGLCSVEFKFSSRDGSYRITEPTVGRVDLQEGASTNSGVDLPYIAYLDAIGVTPEFSKDFTEGIVWINEPFELNSLLQRKRMNGSPAAPFFKHYRGKRAYALFAKDDPGPFFQFVANTGRRGGRYLKKTIGIHGADKEN
ncbi:hypothetical protein ACFL2P_00490 [Candidatus Moduliflexota bacterium]